MCGDREECCGSCISATLRGFLILSPARLVCGKRGFCTFTNLLRITTILSGIPNASRHLPVFILHCADHVLVRGSTCPSLIHVLFPTVPLLECKIGLECRALCKQCKLASLYHTSDRRLFLSLHVVHSAIRLRWEASAESLSCSLVQRQVNRLSMPVQSTGRLRPCLVPVHLIVAVCNITPG